MLAWPRGLRAALFPAFNLSRQADFLLILILSDAPGTSCVLTYPPGWISYYFLYTQILDTQIKIDAVRAKMPARVPVVFSIDEVRRVLCAIPEGPYRAMAGLM